MWSSRGPGIWSAYQAIKHICYGGDWARTGANILAALRNFDRYTKWRSSRRHVDHADQRKLRSRRLRLRHRTSWVASVVNAVGESKFWDSTAIFIFWDDPGGWYNPEKPSYVE